MRWSWPRPAETTLERIRPLLGTFVAIRVGAEGAFAERALAAGFAAIDAVQRSMSFHDPGSELSRLNRDAVRAPQPVSALLARVLRAALALARASDGRFDPSIGGRLVARGLLPAPAAGQPDPAASWRDVRIDRACRVSFARALWLDFGGIAKGFAVDRAVAALRRAGVASGTVNAGGDLRVFGRRERIDVRDPADPARRLPLVEISDGAVASSAGYFADALLDPRSGASLGSEQAVSVCAPRAIWADALTKLVLIDADAARPLLRRLRAEAVLLGRDGQRRRLH